MEFPIKRVIVMPQDAAAGSICLQHYLTAFIFTGFSGVIPGYTKYISGIFLCFHILLCFDQQVEEVNTGSETDQSHNDAHNTIVVKRFGEGIAHKNHKADHENTVELVSGKHKH